MSKKGKHTAFVGILLPEELNNCLRLQSLLQGKSKSKIVRKIVERYVEDNDWTEPRLIKRYADYLLSLWHLRYRETKEFSIYIKEREITLTESVGIPSKLVLAIIKECKEQKEKQSASK